MAKIKICMDCKKEIRYGLSFPDLTTTGERCRKCAAKWLDISEDELR